MLTRLRNLLRPTPKIKRPSIPYSQDSVIVPAECWKSNTTGRLIDLSLAAIEKARTVDHRDIADKMEEFPHWPVIWPGEHYRLLSGLIQVLNPKLVIEIGTATGYSALAMKKFLRPDGKLVTFDIVPWNKFPHCVLREPDFSDGRLVQVIADLTDPATFKAHADLLRKADFVFIDAAKDGIQEQVFIDHFSALSYEGRPVFMFDDIRLMNMIEIWNNLEKPKLDLTSFGHWAGTGLVDWMEKA